MNDFALPDDGSLEERREGRSELTDSKDSMAVESISTKEQWRGIARLVQAETDPAKLMDLAQRLIDEFDKNQSPQSELAGPSKSPPDCTPEFPARQNRMEPSDHRNNEPIAATEDRQFIYRHNSDGSIDSICVRCLRTVANARQESKLELDEREHVCQRTLASGLSPSASAE